MSLSAEQHDQAMEWLRDLFAGDLTRLVLSVLIILSVLPFQWIQTFSLVFFAVFAVELFLRVTLLRHDLKHRSLNRVELLFIAFDVLATLSFLPIEAIFTEVRAEDIRYLRLFRLSRMMLLVGYWGPIVREIWFIMAKRERRYQLFFVAVSVLILSFISAILLDHFQTLGVDFDGDANPANNTFWTLLWWSFLQIQDPGNLLKSPDASVAFFFSLFLTLAGMFIFSFLIGIGASVVEELVRLGKERRLGFRRHTVICNAGAGSQVLLEELVTYYDKSLRSPRIVVMGASPRRHAYMLEGPSQRIRYRQGRPLSGHDLRRVDADRATRVILLGQHDEPTSDSEIVSQLLSVREVNPSCAIYAELGRPENLAAAREAGGERAVPILADRLVGLFLANIVVFPGVQRLYWQLLTSQGDEIYTCLFDRGAMEGHAPPSGPLSPFGELLERAHRSHNVTLLGYLVRDESRAEGFAHRLNPGSRRSDGPEPRSVPRVDELAGFFGVADNFGRLKALVESLPDIAPARTEASQAPRLSFGTCQVARRLERVLLCGFHDGLPDFCEQLILFAGRPTVYIMVSQRRDVRRVARAFVNRAEHHSEPDNQAVRLRFVTERDAVLRYEPVHDADGDGPRGVVQVMVGDWSDEQMLLERPRYGYQLEAMDAVIFTYDPQAADPDARTSLGLIKLMRLRDEGTVPLKPELRIVCEVQNTEKADLFRRRYARATNGDPESCHPVSVVPAEKLRNSIMAQGVFVPGIASIYRELLSETGEEIRRLVVERVADPEEQTDFGSLLDMLYHEHGLLLLGVELRRDDDQGTRLVVNPAPRDPHYRFRAGQLSGFFAIGEADFMPRLRHTCSGCHVGEKLS